MKTLKNKIFNNQLLIGALVCTVGFGILFFFELYNFKKDKLNSQIEQKTRENVIDTAKIDSTNYQNSINYSEAQKDSIYKNSR